MKKLLKIREYNPTKQLLAYFLTGKKVEKLGIFQGPDAPLLEKV